MNELTQIELVTEVDNIARRYRMNYIDAVVFYCEKNNIEMDNIVKLIPSSLKYRHSLYRA